MTDKLTQFDYLLNAMEHAGNAEYPSRVGYGAKRLALFARVRALEKDAERYRHARRCVRMDQFGGYVVHPDDPVDSDGIVAVQFEREIDAAMAKENTRCR